MGRAETKLLGTIDRLDVDGRTRHREQSDPPPQPIIRGRVLSEIATGAYEVEVVGADDTGSYTIRPVYAHGATLSVGDPCFVLTDDSGAFWIMASGGSGGGGDSVEWFGTDKLGFAQTG